ncbi:MAG: Alpha-L-fucosidase [bacterium ADurb.Bin429]|nr:MAG: Alpha-L-fucosidase [bacterium ADurb.Bin429]
MQPPVPHLPVPSERQLRWHDLEFYGFLHFTVNTFTDKEWGYGDESPGVFNPTALDARQWARTAREAGMRGLILTAKHHDGFCLWPSRYTEHSVKNCPWKGGNGDVVREFVDACAEFDLQAGLYLSPWDRNHAEYGRPAYVEYYRNQLEELLTQYGEIFEVWFDGANGGDGYYGGARETRRIDAQTYYNFPALWALVRELQPNAILFSDAGPDIRWVGNEAGYASATCWAKMHPGGIAPGKVDDLNRLGWGEADGTEWRPAEVDVSIRPGWFHHPHEAPRPLDELFAINDASIGRGCCLLLNLPPDRRGLIPDDDIARLREYRAALDARYGHDAAAGKPAAASETRGDAPVFAAANVTDGNTDTYWTVNDDTRAATLTVDLGEPTRVTAIRLEEYLPLGQRVEAFSVELRVWDQWLETAVGTTIGPRRLLTFPALKTDQVRIRIHRAQACPTLKRVSVYTA